MKQEEAKQLPKAKLHPILAKLPAHLKNPANFDTIQRALLDAGATKHSHAEIVDWAGCLQCQRKQNDRKEMMHRLGFENGTQYMLWKKVHEEIKRRDPLVKWK